MKRENSGMARLLIPEFFVSISYFDKQETLILQKIALHQGETSFKWHTFYPLKMG